MLQLAPGEVMADRVAFPPRETGEVKDAITNAPEGEMIGTTVGEETILAGLTVHPVRSAITITVPFWSVL
jgi:hypothetical protein